MVTQIFSLELQLNKATCKTSDTEAPFWTTKIYDKRDDFDLKSVNFLFLDGDVACSTLYGVNIFQLM